VTITPSRRRAGPGPGSATPR